MTQHERLPPRSDLNAPAGNSGWGVFVREWLRRPTAVGAFVPSGHVLAETMIRQIPAAMGERDCVLELGPGTGSMTAAMRDVGIDPKSCVAVEFNKTFLPHLRERFPAFTFIEGDATRLSDTLGPQGWWRPGQYRAIISSLPLRNIPPEKHAAILKGCLDLLRPGGAYIQFTYGPLNSIARTALDELHIKAEQVAFVWRNLPPASVWAIHKPL